LEQRGFSAFERARACSGGSVVFEQHAGFAEAIDLSAGAEVLQQALVSPSL
jgi:hypothetical protein